jgi:hypothetical protein
VDLGLSAQKVADGHVAEGRAGWRRLVVRASEGICGCMTLSSRVGMFNRLPGAEMLFAPKSPSRFDARVRETSA